MIYWVLTSKRYKRILVTKSFDEAYDFITKNYRDVKIREMDWTSKTKIVDRRIFLRSYYRGTEKKHNMFIMAELIIKGKNNFYNFLDFMEMKDDYRRYIQITKNKL